MGDETSSTMNLDLNLDPSPSSDDEPSSDSLSNVSSNMENSIGEPARMRARQRWRTVWQQLPAPRQTRYIALELEGNPSNGDGRDLPTSVVSASAEERSFEVIKTLDNNANHAEEEALGKKEDDDKGNVDEGSFFNCNICLDLARNPVVTCCGHLFCWPCIYRWLHLYSVSKECPVCKGEVTMETVTPIYGPGRTTHEPEDDPNLSIPPRPQAHRVESWRQAVQRNEFAVPMEELIRRLGRRFDMTRDLLQLQDTDRARTVSERNSLFLHRILTSRAMRSEQNTVVPPDEVVDIADSSPPGSAPGDGLRPSSLFLRRPYSHRSASIASLVSAERSFQSYSHHRPMEGNQEQPPSVDDRNSFSSIAAVIHSGSQTVDSAVSVSSSSSRRRHDASRVSDVDSDDSRPPRRRRVN